MDTPLLCLALGKCQSQSLVRNLMPHAGWPIGGREHALQRAHLKVRCVDKDSGRPVGASQVSFQDLNGERQMVTHELRRLQDDDSVLDGCVTLAKDGDSCVRWILGETFALFAPTLNQMRC